MVGRPALKPKWRRRLSWAGKFETGKSGSQARAIKSTESCAVPDKGPTLSDKTRSGLGKSEPDSGANEKNTTDFSDDGGLVKRTGALKESDLEHRTRAGETVHNVKESFSPLSPAPGDCTIELKDELSKPRPCEPSYLSSESGEDQAKSENNVLVQHHHSNGPDETFSSPTTGDDASSSKDDIFSKVGSDRYTDSPNSTPPPPPTLDEIDSWNQHIDMKAFGESLQKAANAVFPNERKSRYTKVSVLLLSWEDEDPRLPVSAEIEKLERIFRETYNFETECWRIPDENSHYRLAEKVMTFVKPEDNGSTHLKILYYAGHARLLQNRSLAWTSWQNKGSSKPPLVKWGAIQSFLEEAENDALILLDCCASGTANTSEGNGVTELISACAWNETANGVGLYSLTASLIIELELLSKRFSFSVGELYRNIFLRTQVRLPENFAASGEEIERHPAPIHLVLTQVRPNPRSIHLSAHIGPQSTIQDPSGSSKGNFESTAGFYPERYALQDGDKSQYVSPNKDGTVWPGPKDHPLFDMFNTTSISSQGVTQLPRQWEGAPRLAFSIRLRETIKPDQNLEMLFADWLKDMPVVAEEVKVEAGFGSLSTLLIVSLPMALSAYLPRDPAIRCLGPITSSNNIPMTMNITGLDIFTLLRSKTSEGTALRDSLGKFLKIGEEGYGSSSKAQEDLLNAVISNYRKTSKSEVKTGTFSM